jgi:Ni/Co efflux regulator RcnB
VAVKNAPRPSLLNPETRFARHERKHVMNAQELKAQCETLWHGNILAVANRVEFFALAGKLSWKNGAAVNPTIGKEAAAFIRKCAKHYAKWPAIPANREIGKLKPPKWLIENYKRNCPRNYKALIEAYGETRTKYDKYDAPLPGEVWRGGKLIVHDYRGHYYTLTDWQRFKRRAERAKERQAIRVARSPVATVERLYSQLRDLFGAALAA